MAPTPDLECLAHGGQWYPAEDFDSARDGSSVHLKPAPHFALSAHPAVEIDGDWVIDRENDGQIVRPILFWWSLLPDPRF